MYVDNIKNINEISIKAPGVLNAVKKTLIGPDQGWQGWVMRLFTLAPEGHSPRHIHPWPHINYITGGEGILFLEGKEYPLEPGSVAYVPGGAEHQFLNRGKEHFSFICIVPEEGDK